jgi:hypothetical protein
MAWTYTQNFDSLNTAALAGQDSWTKDNGLTMYDSVQETTKFAGAKGAKTAGYTSVHRTITDVTAGRVYIAMRANSGGSGDGLAFQFKDGSADIIRTRFVYSAPNLTFEYYNGSWRSLFTASFNTWYIISFEFDATNQANKAKIYYKESGGSFSDTGYVSSVNNWSAVDTIIFYSDSGEYYFDEISNTDPDVPATNIKTINGLAKASIKTINGLAIASVKTYNGLA